MYDNHLSINSMTPQERIHDLERKVHNLTSLLYYHKKKCSRLEETVIRLIKGAISIEYGPLVGLADEILVNLNQGASKEHLSAICMKWLRMYLGTQDQVSALALEINRETGGMVDSLLDDCPDFGILETNFFACMVICVRDRLLTEIFEMGKPSSTAYEKHMIYRTVKNTGTVNHNYYMKLLGSKDCTYGKKLLSLHDLKKFPNGKPEKNKD